MRTLRHELPRLHPDGQLVCQSGVTDSSLPGFYCVACMCALTAGEVLRHNLWFFKRRQKFTSGLTYMGVCMCERAPRRALIIRATVVGMGTCAASLLSPEPPFGSRWFWWAYALFLAAPARPPGPSTVLWASLRRNCSFCEQVSSHQSVDVTSPLAMTSTLHQAASESLLRCLPVLRSSLLPGDRRAVISAALCPCSPTPRFFLLW